MLVDEFRGLLKNKSIAPRIIVRKHLIYGDPYCFQDRLDSYISLKEEIADRYKLHPHNVIMVGSGKLGFSIAPQKNWKSFDEDSDIDMVIVSERAFESIWQELFLFNSNTSRDEKEENNFLKFKDYFFRGWIRPDLFAFEYDGKREWFEFFHLLTKKYGFGHKIVGAMYFNFNFFEKYHIANIENLRLREIQNG